jgi:hypothetical protein
MGRHDSSSSSSSSCRTRHFFLSPFELIWNYGSLQTVGRTPWTPALSQGRYLQGATQTQNEHGQTSVLWLRLEPTSPVSERGENISCLMVIQGKNICGVCLTGAEATFVDTYRHYHHQYDQCHVMPWSDSSVFAALLELPPKLWIWWSHCLVQLNGVVHVLLLLLLLTANGFSPGGSGWPGGSGIMREVNKDAYGNLVTPEWLFERRTEF